MGRFRKFFDDYFDDRIAEIQEQNNDDPDLYDETHEVNRPDSPIWDGSEIHYNPYGPDPSLPDPNEINQD